MLHCLESACCLQHNAPRSRSNIICPGHSRAVSMSNHCTGSYGNTKCSGIFDRLCHFPRFGRHNLFSPDSDQNTFFLPYLDLTGFVFPDLNLISPTWISDIFILPDLDLTLFYFPPRGARRARPGDAIPRPEGEEEAGGDDSTCVVVWRSPGPCRGGRYGGLRWPVWPFRYG